MTHTYEEYDEAENSDDILREKLRKWGILKDETTSSIYSSLSEIFNELKTKRYTRDIFGELDALKQKVQELEKRVGGKREFTKADLVIEFKREELEKDHFGKIVAIDPDSMSIVGIGNSVLEAYREAKEKTGKDQFDFRRIGYKYVYRA